jgi:hypothetical protein
MSAINRFRKMFSGGTRVHGDALFQSYYGNLISSGRDGGPSAQEARRDFENVRSSVSRLTVY